MSIHPLRLAYQSYIGEHYGARPSGRASGVDERAQAIRATGLSYEHYIEFACSILHNTVEYYGWPYPYWNAVVSDVTIDKVKRSLELVQDSLIDEDYAAMFNEQLHYSMTYIKWWQGLIDKRPARLCVPIPAGVRVDVAKYICDMYGVPFNSSNLNVVASAVKERLNGQHF